MRSAPRTLRFAAATALLLAAAAAAASPPPVGKGDPATAALPDIFGPGAVLRAGDVRMKVTNYGHLGNIFTNVSDDPSGQWPDSSGVEYLNGILLAVGAVDFAGSPAHPRRVSYFTHWRPPTLDPEDRIYATHAGAANGARFVNEDSDFLPGVGPIVDEETLDGRDNDGDGLIDEDFGAIGAEQFSCVMRDDTPEAMAADTNHVPLGIECRQQAWCESRPGFTDFNVVEYTFLNRSGRTLDSLFIGWSVDMDAGPTANPQYFMDDQDLPGFPSGEFLFLSPVPTPKEQFPHSPNVEPPVPADSALCPRWPVRIHGFALRDADGDGGLTPGAAAFLLVDHSVDAMGFSAPARVGFRAFRSFLRGTPFGSGGNPMTSEERYQLMSGTEGVDPVTGFITVPQGATPGDYSQWCSIGPYRNVPAGGSVRATIAFAVQQGSTVTMSQYAADYQAYRSGALGGRALLAKYPLLRAAFDLELYREGTHEIRGGIPVTDFHGRETRIVVPAGSPPQLVRDCNGNVRVATDTNPIWVDLDCDYCTGVWSYTLNTGYVHHTWYAPPPTLVGVPPAPRISRWTAIPNPARDEVRFEAAVVGEGGGGLQIAVFDLAGREVRTAVTGPGSPTAWTWDLADDSGRRVRPGLYFGRARTASGERTVRVVVAE